MSNLPPGVTQHEIDDAHGCPEICEDCAAASHGCGEPSRDCLGPFDRVCGDCDSHSEGYCENADCPNEGRPMSPWWDATDCESYKDGE